MDPQRSDMRPAEALAGPERDARIEQLLLAGLDEYFAHRYEHAINLWTRVLFLDRQHDRARAYIERARRAQAERERESDAALHQAVDAFQAGDVARARALVGDALDRGASLDDADGMLERIERLSGTTKVQRLPGSKTAKFQSARPPGFSGGRTPSGESQAEHVGPADARRGRGWSAAVLLIAAAVGVLIVGVWGVAVPEPAAWPMFSPPSSAARSIPWTPDPLPQAQASEYYLARARVFSATGRLRDALSALDRIPTADPLRRDADQLRADVQRQLLALAFAERPPE
jgi:tetratricopeptide (TPR) repeat protein